MMFHASHVTENSLHKAYSDFHVPPNMWEYISGADKIMEVFFLNTKDGEYFC